jgi:hypothetical protein
VLFFILFLDFYGESNILCFIFSNNLGGIFLTCFTYSLFLCCQGYFDVRDENEQWIRVAVKKGGMIVLPAGMYHRFTLDSNNYIKVLLISSFSPTMIVGLLKASIY